MNRPALVLVAAAALLACCWTQSVVGATVAEFDRASRLAMSADYHGALEQYESFLSRAPGDRLCPVAAIAIANIQLLALHDSSAAVKSYDRVVTDYPTSPWAAEAARQKGVCMEARADWEEAGETYQLALDLATHTESGQSEDWVNEVTASAANAFYRAGDQPRVIATYRRVLDGAPPPEVAATALYRLGETYESGNEDEMAAESYAQILEAYPSSEIFQSAVAKRELIDKHRKVDWGSVEMYADATALSRQGDFEGAVRKCDELLASSANERLRECTEYRKITLETSLRGDYTEGCERLRRYIQDHPEGLRTSVAQTTLEEQWSPIADLEASARENPNEAEILRALGGAYLNARATSRAIEMLSKAVALDPDREGPHLELGYAQTQAGNNEEALKEFTFYLERHPDDVNTLNMIGYNYIRVGQPENAIPYFQRYVEVAPDEANAHDSLGEGYLEAGRLEDAAMEYRRAVEIDPSFSNSHFMLGRVYQQMEKKTEAIEAFRRFLELDVSGPQADQARAALEQLQAP